VDENKLALIIYHILGAFFYWEEQMKHIVSSAYGDPASLVQKVTKLIKNLNKSDFEPQTCSLLVVFLISYITNN
jgi:hypothetical protein